MVAGYYLDFACEAEKLAVELDGGQHNDAVAKARDAARTARIEQSGWRVLRFWNNEVIENIEGVVLTIRDALTRTLSK
jgi:very-short-patch-repair endonuclease